MAVSFHLQRNPSFLQWVVEQAQSFLHLCCNTEKEGLLELVKTIYIFVYIFSLFVYFYASFARWIPVWVLPSLHRFAQLPLAIPILHEPSHSFFLLLLRVAAAAKSLQSCPTLCDPIDDSPPGSPSLGFSRQEHWSGLPFLSPMHESEK